MWRRGEAALTQFENCFSDGGGFTGTGTIGIKFDFYIVFAGPYDAFCREGESDANGYVAADTIEIPDTGSRHLEIIISGRTSGNGGCLVANP